MARNVFFSFDYRKVWKVSQIQNIPNVTGVPAAGFKDSSLWETMTAQPETTERAIRNALDKTTVTVVFVTRGTKENTYINFGIDQSLARGNGLVGVQIHHLKDRDGSTGSAGAMPDQIAANNFKAYKYSSPQALADWIEEAAQVAGH